MISICKISISVNILEGNYVTDFPNNTAKRGSYGLEISRIIETNIYFKTYFHVLGIYHAGYIMPLKTSKKVKHSIKAEIPLLHFNNKLS